MRETFVVIPNWNGADSLAKCLDSLLHQAHKAEIIVVDNGSSDDSVELISKKYPGVKLITLPKNRGFAGGVNAGINQAMSSGAKYIALLNNDAVADKNWLKSLVDFMSRHKDVGIATSKILNSTAEYLDSTGDIYTIWGLPYPRGRREAATDIYDKSTWIFAASGGASLYRVEMLEDIGLFDEDFFAYYEDVDISFRAQLSGWKVAYVPQALVQHHIGGTSSRLKGFSTYQTMKNLPWLMFKNVPRPLIWKVLWRFKLAYWLFYFKAVSQGRGLAATKGLLVMVALLPKKFWQRWAIQKKAKVPASYIDSIITHDLPPNAYKLRLMRNLWWMVRRKKQ